MTTAADSLLGVRRGSQENSVANLNTEGKLGEHPIGNHDQPLVEIVFKEGVKLNGRTPGKVYLVDEALAYHFCETAGQAERVAKSPAPVEDRALKGAPNDRSMKGKGA